MQQDGYTVLQNYRMNRAMIQKVRPQDIKVVIISHCHVDHVGLIPALFASGKCSARIIIPQHSTPILKEMWMDSAYINSRDSDYLTCKTGKAVPPLFTEEDVLSALQHVEEYDSHEIHKLEEGLSIRYIPAGHIMLSQQCELFIGKSHIKKVLFTGDLGNIKIQERKYYVEPFEPVNTANIVIGECTYCQRGRNMSTKDLNKDLEKIRTVINQYCVDYNRRVLIPVFSLDRTPYMLSIVYDLFGHDESFTVPVLVDSPLAIRLLWHYSSILTGEQKKRFDEVLSWKNLRLIVDPEESKACISEMGPKLVLSSSGMLTAGRSVRWVENFLPHDNDCILFCGYAGEDTLAYKIKNGKSQKTVSINGKAIKNRCQIVDLKSCSSHMQRDDLINYYKGIHCEKIYLVHGDMKYKPEFKADLEEAIRSHLRSTKVIAVNSSTSIAL